MGATEPEPIESLRVRFILPRQWRRSCTRLRKCARWHSCSPLCCRSWEKEFPRIGVQKSADSPRLYRQSDLDQVLRIKDLVFREGLTLSGAKRRLEAAAPPSATATDDEVEEVLEALASDARTRIAHVRDGLRSILRVLSSAPGTVVDR